MKPRGHIDLKGEMKERMIHMVPAEPLWDVFTPDVIANLRQVRSPSQRLQTRLRILDAGGLNPNPVNRELRAHKAAWEAYLTAAFAIGLFEGSDGVELRARLTGTDDHNFFSAISQCFGAWYLAGRRRLELLPRPRGQGAKRLEYSTKCDGGDINVEVKAPYRLLGDEFFWGDDADLLEKALQSANRQFAKGQRNLLVVHPRLRLSIFPQFCRMPIERAFIGEDVIRIPLNPATGGPAGPAHTAFKQSGRFVKLWPEPRHTRISAVLSLNEYEEGGEVKPRALMVHNPNAEMPLPRDMWQGIPEFFLNSNRWRWSAAHPWRRRSWPRARLHEDRPQDREPCDPFGEHGRALPRRGKENIRRRSSSCTTPPERNFADLAHVAPGTPSLG